MWKIIVSMIISAVGVYNIIGSGTPENQYGNIPAIQLGFGILLQIGSFVLLLYGLRDFFMGDLMSELNSIKQRIPIPPAAPVVSDPNTNASSQTHH